jgi:hypothetical protein
MAGKGVKMKILKVSKDFLLASRLLQILQPLNGFFGFVYKFNMLTSWVHKNKKAKTLLMNDFYRTTRNYDDRLKSFTAIVDRYNFSDTPISYLEFGVASGHSFKWWLQHTKNADSRYYGFDTFEGLPENWGMFAKGEMASPIPEVNDSRASFIKGIFQDTLNDFLDENGKRLKDTRLVIHMDADLYSATLFALSQLFPYIKKGDIIMFDEFNVYDHEFLAFKYFTECFYVNLQPVSACNNFYHAAFEVM